MAMKICLVTGAHGNMGRAMVEKFSNDGFVVVGVDASAPRDAVSYESHVVDLLNEDAAGALVQATIAKHSTIDVAVFTVGGFAMGSIAETKTSDVLQQYKLNFETAYNVARPVFLQMMAQGAGRIFLVGARPALSAGGSNGLVAYGLAKSLIFRLAEMMNEEAKNAYPATNVTVNVVVPSIIDTPQNRAAMPDADFTKWVTPEQIAEAVSFHASERASALRESVIKIYGNT